VTLFLDSSFLYSLLARRHSEVRALFFSSESKVTNDYVMKEMRRVLLSKGYSVPDIEAFFTFVRGRCRVLPSPSKARFASVRLTDRSDVPILLGAMDAKAILVTLDRRLARESQSYVQSVCLDPSG